MAERIWNSDLGGLADPAQFTARLDIAGHDTSELLGMLRSMLQIRIVEERIADLVVAGAARTPCHLGIGQEAVAVGVCANLHSTDRVFGGHRSHSQFLALGGSPYGLVAEILGKVHGASHGMGGSMHLYGASVGFQGSVPLVGATIPIAVGAALAAQMDGQGAVAVAFFGDGACEEGVFHESLNLAAVYNLPVLFVCENNLFASHLDIQFRQPSDRIARYGEAHRIASATVDGNDVLAVREAAGQLIQAARAGKGPGLLEAITYRFRGHVGPNEDIDVGVHRRMEDVHAWKKRCPIRRMADALIAEGAMTPEGLQALQTSIAAEIDAAVDRAKAAPDPDAGALRAFVYASDNPCSRS
jgi:pyruvate dehydrogenase E1 component alpha subunit